MIIALCGSNQFLRQQKLAELRQEFITRHGADGIEEYTAEKISLESLPTIFGGTTLFSTHRFVVLKQLSENKLVAEKVLQNLTSVSVEVTIVIVEAELDKRTAYYKELKKLEQFYEYGEVSERELLSWIGEQVTQEGGQIDNNTAAILVQSAGSNQQRLMHEIHKLVTYDKNITTQTIQLLVEPDSKDSVFELLECALGGQKNQAIELLSRLERAHEDPFQLVNMFIWQVHILAVVSSAENKTEKEIATDTKLNPYVVSKTRRLATKFNRTQIQHTVRVTADLDLALKTGSTDPWRQLEQKIVSL